METTTYKAAVTSAFNAAAATYDRMGVQFFAPMGERLVQLAAPAAGGRVLDIGCGRGACLFPAAAAVGPGGSVLGIDITPAMIDEAAAEIARHGLSATVQVRVMDGEDPRLPAGSFDVITGSYSVIFMPDAPQAISRYAHLLTPGGRLAFTSPVFTDDTFPFLPPLFTALIPRRLLRNLPPAWQPDELRRRFNSWLADPGDLTATMRRAGFTDVHVIDEEIDMVAASGEAWVDWSHTQGMRLLWQHLPPAESAELRERLITALDDLRPESGPLSIPVPVRFVTATTEPA